MKRKTKMLVQLTEQLIKELDRSMMIFFADRPSFWNKLSSEELAFVKNEKGNEKDNQMKTKLLVQEIQNLCERSQI